MEAHPRNGVAFLVRLKVKERVSLVAIGLVRHAILGQSHRTVYHGDQEGAETVKVVAPACPLELQLVGAREHVRLCHYRIDLALRQVLTRIEVFVRCRRTEVP